MGEAKIEETVCEDRISALSEDLLVTILLLIPIKDAIATMFLSKRWRFIWMMLPRLEYKEIKDDESKKKSIWWFFEKSMELHKAPVLENLIIKLGPGCPSDADVEKSLAKAVERHVGVLIFKLRWSSTVPTRLPKSLYSCETLTELKLSHKILVDFPSSSSSSSCLPSLIFLDLFYVVYKDEASLVRLLSSCPVLEFLSVIRNKDDNVTNFSVKVPSLHCLFYYNYTSVLPPVDTGGCLAIDTPALRDYRVTDESRDSWLIENMPCLNSASIDVNSFPDIENFKTSLSKVVDLELFMTDEVLVGCTTINFSLLKKLSICPQLQTSSDWLEQLFVLLKNAPKLKHLLVNYGYNITTLPKDRAISWSQPSSIPGCLSSQLEIFEYREYGGKEDEEEFLTYILANSKCLKTVTISASPSFDLEEKELINDKLRDIPRVSPTSQLFFK